jgi:cytochrome b
MASAESTTRTAVVTVWDPLVRVLHWSLAVGVAVAFVSDEARALHEAAGYLALAIVLLRVVWGVIGPRHARFRDFVRSPRIVIAYIADILRMRPRRYLGHNPAGGAMIVLMLVLVTVAGASGWLSQTDRFFGVGWVENLHAASANLLIALAVAHVAGVVLASFQHRENLIGAMFSGKKRL